ncbi:MAG: septum formation initiator family protein [Patescibacteria group bacterium]
MFDFLLKFKVVVVLGLVALSTYNIIKTTGEVYKSSKRTDELKVAFDQAKTQNDALKKDLEYKNSVNFIESEARNKLNMVKPGEKIVIPSEVLGVENSGEQNAFDLKFLTTITQEPNYKKWLRLFLTR